MSREQAARLLTYHLRRITELAGGTWTIEHTNDMGELVDALLDAMAADAQAIQEILERHRSMAQSLERIERQLGTKP